MGHYIVTLIGGRIVVGHLVEATETEIVLSDERGLIRRIQKHRIEEIISPHGFEDPVDDDDDDDDGGGDDEDFDPFDPDLPGGLIIQWARRPRDI
jgi:hypothetical protein